MLRMSSKAAAPGTGVNLDRRHHLAEGLGAQFEIRVRL
jgi:hypothetical protein